MCVLRNLCKKRTYINEKKNQRGGIGGLNLKYKQSSLEEDEKAIKMEDRRLIQFVSKNGFFGKGSETKMTYSIGRDLGEPQWKEDQRQQDGNKGINDNIGVGWGRVPRISHF